MEWLNDWRSLECGIRMVSETNEKRAAFRELNLWCGCSIHEFWGSMWHVLIKLHLPLVVLCNSQGSKTLEDELVNFDQLAIDRENV